MASIVAAFIAASLAMAMAPLAVAADKRSGQPAHRLGAGVKPVPVPLAGARTIPETWAELKKAPTRPSARRASGKAAGKTAVKTAARTAAKPVVAAPGRLAAAAQGQPAANAARRGRPGRPAARPVRSPPPPLAMPASAVTAWRFDAATAAATGPASTRWPVAVDAMANRMAVFWGREVSLGVGARGWTGDVQARPQHWGLRLTLSVAIPP
jgi:hypothetical protein